VKFPVFSKGKMLKTPVPNSFDFWTAQGGRMRKVRFVFGKEMTALEMWEAFKKFAREAGFETKDTHTKKKVRNETPRRRKNADRD
jgi:hypothetical protein